MKHSTLIALGLLGGCGDITHHVQVSGTANVAATVTYQVSVANLVQYFTGACKAQLGSNATLAEINDCSDGAIFQLIGIIKK